MGRSVQPRSPRRKKSSAKGGPNQLSQQILGRVRERILNWYYPPGHHLGEHALCAEFSASRIPVREALNTLAEQGLVDKWPNRGCYVKQPDLDALQQLYDFRLALELFVVERLATTGVAREFVERNRSYWRPLVAPRASAKVDGLELVRADEAFHLGLAQQLGNAYLVEALTDINERLRFVRLVVVTNPDRVQSTAHEHLAVLDALVDRNGRAAKNAMHTNIDAARSKVEAALAQALTNAHRRSA